MKAISESTLKKRIAGKKVLIDTNIIIYLTDAIQPYEPLSRSLFEMVEAGDAAAVISIISVAEVIQGPIRKGHYQIAQDVKDYLLNFPNLTCQEVTRGVLEHMGTNDLVDWQKLRTVDGLIIASGLENSVDLFISNDAHFKKAIPRNYLMSFETLK